MVTNGIARANRQLRTHEVAGAIETMETRGAAKIADALRT